MHPSEIPANPMIEKLKQGLASGSKTALDEFWQSVFNYGTPLIEPIEGDRSHMLVTFLWRGTDDLRNVVVVDGIAGADFAANQLTRLPGTDVWYKSYCTRKDVRTVYTFSVNDPLLNEEDPGWAEHQSALFAPDPLNPRLFLGEDSLLELPDAPPEPWIVHLPDVPPGQVTRQRFQSRLLRNERDLWIYTPPGFMPETGAYPWMLLFDGGGYISLPTPIILDNLLAAGRIPPVVGIFVGNASGARTHELTCNERFLAFLCQELLPWVHERYAITNDPKQVVVGGVSYGGLTAAFGALRHPDVFGNVLSQSGAFWWVPGLDDRKIAPRGAEQNWLLHQYVKSAPLPVRFHLSVGLLEKSVPARNITSTTLSVNSQFQEILETKGYDVTCAEFPGGHDFAGWRGILPEAIESLLGQLAR